MEGLHNEGDRGAISYIGGFSCARTASEDAADATEGISDVRPFPRFREYL